MTILRREHVAGICHKKYTTKATFRGKVHEICIDCTRVSTRDDSRLCFSMDGKRVLVVKHLQWKFRGNERVEIDGVHIQVAMGFGFGYGMKKMKKRVLRWAKSSSLSSLSSEHLTKESNYPFSNEHLTFSY
ncbi:NADPH oxidase [Tanacetum coccineum]